jgi:hypothetical protein
VHAKVSRHYFRFLSIFPQDLPTKHTKYTKEVTRESPAFADATARQARMISFPGIVFASIRACLAVASAKAG